MISCGLCSFCSCPSLLTPPQSRINVDKLEKHRFRLGLRTTESQNGSGWKGPQWFIWSKPAPAGSSWAQGTGLCPNGSGTSPVRETSHPLWTIYSNACSLHRKVLPHIQMELPGISFCFLCYCLPPPNRAWLHSLTSSLHLLIHTFSLSSLVPGKRFFYASAPL